MKHLYILGLYQLCSERSCLRHRWKKQMVTYTLQFYSGNFTILKVCVWTAMIFNLSKSKLFFLITSSVRSTQITHSRVTSTQTFADPPSIDTPCPSPSSLPGCQAIYSASLLITAPLLIAIPAHCSLADTQILTLMSQTPHFHQDSEIYGTSFRYVSGLCVVIQKLN